MESFSAVIMAFGGPAKFAAAIAITASHAGVMSLRDSIPAEYWDAVVNAASARKIEGVTYEALAQLAARRRPSMGSTGPESQAVSQ